MDEYTRREMLRFLSKIKTLNNGCWEWTSTINRKGYGVLSVHGKPVAAYRVSYMLFRGEIPPAMQIDHICHNRACVNPNHLRLATTTQNNENHTGATVELAFEAYIGKPTGRNIVSKSSAKANVIGKAGSRT